MDAPQALEMQVVADEDFRQMEERGRSYLFSFFLGLFAGAAVWMPLGILIWEVM